MDSDYACIKKLLERRDVRVLVERICTAFSESPMDGSPVVLTQELFACFCMSALAGIEAAENYSNEKYRLEEGLDHPLCPDCNSRHLRDEIYCEVL